MRYAIVELHDVSPFHKEEVYNAIEFLEKLHVEKFSLLLIPNFRGEYAINRYAPFVSFIEKTKQEIIMHGYTHTGKKRLQHLLYTYGEGEFGEGDLEETYLKLEKALEIFQAMRLDTKVFVPPAWIGNPWLDDLLYSFGFLGVGYRGKIKDLQSGEEIKSPVLTFSNRYGLSYISIKTVPILFKLLDRYPFLRLALHTADFKDKRKVALWRLIINQIKKERRLISYGELLSKGRPSPSFQGVQPTGGLVQSAN
ncbi:polysaccharide deacetylase family protein [Thermocrinis sp.]|uniref:polysaccharide deacetylase family protein n=1 Tax=Thermocrinis sp. TaxID=2024383 RepID=UPI002FDE548F